jgi:hypothetical protein
MLDIRVKHYQTVPNTAAAAVSVAWARSAALLIGVLDACAAKDEATGCRVMTGLLTVERDACMTGVVILEHRGLTKQTEAPNNMFKSKRLDGVEGMHCGGPRSTPTWLHGHSTQP